MILIYANMSIKLKCYVFLFIESTNKWEWLTPIPNFSIELSKSFTLFLFNFLHKFMMLTTFQSNFCTSFDI